MGAKSLPWALSTKREVIWHQFFLDLSQKRKTFWDYATFRSWSGRAVFASGQKYVKNPPLRDLIKIKTSIFLWKLLKNECLEF